MNEYIHTHLHIYIYIYLFICQAHVNQIIGYICRGPTIICIGKNKKLCAAAKPI